MTKPEGYDGFYADAATEREAEQYMLAGYVEKGAIPIDSRGAEYIYVVSEEGFDGCTVPVFVRGE